MPAGDKIAKIAKVLKVSTDWLLTGSDVTFNDAVTSEDIQKIVYDSIKITLTGE